MNIHPIFIHFPIALLITYGVIELIPFRAFRSHPNIFFAKTLLSVLGALGSYAALLTGEAAGQLIPANVDQSIRALVQTHEFWAQTSVTIFSILAAAYVVAWLNYFSVFKNTTVIQRAWPLLNWLKEIILSRPISIILALAGIISITITGALGGSIVYGPSGDPFTDWVYHLFF